MGFWHDHGVIDFSIFFVRGRNSDVAGAGEEDLPVRLTNGQDRSENAIDLVQAG